MWGQLCVVMNCLIVNPDWDSLLEERRMYELHQFAASTQATRSVQLAAYMEFCDTFSDRLQPYPCDMSQICLYIVYLARRLSFSSIRNYISALNNHLKDLSYPPIDYEDYRLKKCMSGVKRVKGVEVKRAAPLLPKDLLKMFGKMTVAPAHTSVRAAMLLSFRALLRKCHVTSSDSSLLRQDFSFKSWGILLTLRKSKTNQYREHLHQIPVSKVRDMRMCPVYWVQKHFDECPAHNQAKAFRVPKGENSVPLTYDFYLSVIKNLSALSGLDHTSLSTHSLRRGGATFLRMSGASLQVIKERGEWSSDAVYLYLQTSLTERLTADLRVSLYIDAML